MFRLEHANAPSPCKTRAWFENDIENAPTRSRVGRSLRSAKFEPGDGGNWNACKDVVETVGFAGRHFTVDEDIACIRAKPAQVCRCADLESRHEADKVTGCERVVQFEIGRSKLLSLVCSHWRFRSGRFLRHDRSGDGQRDNGNR